MATRVGGKFVKRIKGEGRINHVRTAVEGITFDSKREAERYKFLRQREKAGEIGPIERQLNFPFVHDGVKICTYRCDFAYFDLQASKRVYEDVKGWRTEIYKLKKKMLKAFYPGVTLLET